MPAPWCRSPGSLRGATACGSRARARAIAIFSAIMFWRSRRLLLAPVDRGHDQVPLLPLRHAQLPAKLVFRRVADDRPGVGAVDLEPRAVGLFHFVLARLARRLDV